MTVDPDKVIFATTLDTFKRDGDDVKTTMSIPSQSYTSGQTRSFSTSLDLNRNDGTALLLKRFSFIGSNYYSTATTLSIDANFRTDSFFTIDQNIITFTCLVWNASGSTQSLTGFTIDIIARKFVTPYLSP